MGSSEVLIQALLILIAVISVVFLQTLPKRLLSLRRRHHQSSSSSSSSQSRRHFIAGAQTLTQARRHSPPSPSLLKSALSSADLAISLDPRDAAPHLLKALALHLLGRHVPAVRSIDVALSPPQAKTLGVEERADALVKRAELHLVINRRRRLDLAIRDLEEARGLLKKGGGGGKVLVMLGECYEMKGRVEEARMAFEEAEEVEGRKGLLERLAAKKVGA